MLLLFFALNLFASQTSGNVEEISWEKIEPPTNEVVIPYEDLVALSNGKLHAHINCKLVNSQFSFVPVLKYKYNTVAVL